MEGRKIMNDTPLNITIIAAKAKVFVEAKEAAKAIEKLRNETLGKCEKYNAPDRDEDGWHEAKGNHCWNLPRDLEGNMTRWDDFCEPCKESSRLHREWVKARQLEAGKLRSLVRFVKESKATK